MTRILAISDIHGDDKKFKKLLDKVNYDPTNDQLILVGDYVDRGPNAKGVINMVMDLKEKGAIVLSGNHDEMMVAAANNEERAWERWERKGALFTLQSYDPTIEDMRIPEDETFHEHVAFLKTLDYYYETDDYIFVHGGVHPSTPIHDTDPWTLTWIREEFHNGYQGEKPVIFGHTRTAHFHGGDKHDVYFGSNNIIGIDGGAVYGGQLNCLELPSKKVVSVK